MCRFINHDLLLVVPRMYPEVKKNNVNMYTKSYKHFFFYIQTKTILP